MTEERPEIHPKTVRAVTRVVAASKQAAGEVASSSAEIRNRALVAIADAFEAGAEEIVSAAAEDAEVAQRKRATAPSVHRLLLSESQVHDIVRSVRTIAALPDPVGEVLEGRTLPNGIRLERVRAPLGVIGAIHSDRPSAIVGTAALAMKAGNAAVVCEDALGRSTSTLLVELMRTAVATAGLPASAIASVGQWGPDGARVLMAARDHVDLLIPHGNQELVSEVVRESLVPVVETASGNVHIYLDASATVRMSTDIVLNSKTQAPDAWNSVETLLVHERAARRVLPKLLAALSTAGVVMHAGPDVGEFAPAGVALKRVARRDWAKEYLGLDVAIKIVGGLDEAIDHIHSYSTGHTEVIVTNDIGNAEAFVEAVDAAAVGVNVSTRFTDGGEFGLGSDAGISTQKLHARGPMGPRALTTSKWIMRGFGQIRG